MIKITIETETPSDIRALIESFTNNNRCGDHNKPCHKQTEKEPYIGPIWRINDVGTADPVKIPTDTHSITAPDTSNITLTCTGSGSTPANKQDIPFETVKKILEMARTTISTFETPDKKEVQ